MDIRTSAFQGCILLVAVQFPSALLRLRGNAFYGCTSLKSVGFLGNNIETIEGGVFQHCTSLNDVTLPDSITQIDTYAFEG
jgi:hypothetical protein